MDYTEVDRSLMESRAQALYEEAVMGGGVSQDDRRFTEDPRERQALDLLVRLGVFMVDRSVRRFIAVDPTTVSSAVISPLSAAGSKLLLESAEWAKVFGNMAQTYRRSPEGAKGPFREVRGEAIEPFLNSLLADAQEELLTAQPTTGRSRRALDAAKVRDLAALERGVKMRTLYQHSVRRNVMTQEYVFDVTKRGAEVKTLDEFFLTLIVVDNKTAIIPAVDRSVALAIIEPSIVSYLADIFERHWERGRPFIERETTLLREISAEQRAMTIRMLIGGHSDPLSAKRLGVSPRTYAMYVADLKTEHDSQSRFQLGYTMGRLGVTGNERDVETDGPAPASEQR